MSRLIVKNLPKSVTEDNIRDLFQKYGTINDLQMKYKNGIFRQFAFIGYKSENDAKDAIDALDKTFINSTRISVEPCALLGDLCKKSHKKKDEEKQKDGEKQKDIEEKKIVEENETVELLKKYKNDPLFEDYLQVHQKEAQIVKNLISEYDVNDENNEDSDLEEQRNSDDAEDSQNDKLADKNISDIDYMKQLKEKSKKTKVKKVKEKVDFFTIKLKGLPYHCKKKHIKTFLKPLTAQSIRVPPKIHGIAFVGFKDEKKFKKALSKNKSFLDGHQILVTNYNISTQKINETNTDDSKKSQWFNQEESLKNEEEIAESGRLFIRNLAYSVTEDDLRPLFEKYGPITELNLPIDTTSRKIKGFGIVTYLMPEHAVKAYGELDGTICQGRMLHLLPAKALDKPENNNLEGSTNYKQKKIAQLKAKAGQSFNWNALFLGQNAVAENMSKNEEVLKKDIVNPDAKGSLAVRLALGETGIIEETKSYLQDAGVNLDAFQMSNCKRSNKIILVKNLPCQTSTSEIMGLFEKHGIISRVILPPSGITAIVEFQEAIEARKAFRSLAYSKFKNMPLYLEWAPVHSLTEKTTKDLEKTDKKEELKTTDDIKKTVSTLEKEEDDEEPEPDTTLFIKNLNFKTTDDDLKKFFEKCGKIHYATVAKKKDPNNPGSTLSMGYGFVRFKTKEAANKALKNMQQSVLDGKSLELKRSERIIEAEEAVKRKAVKKTKQNGTKIMVKNVPFQANTKEIQELFGVFGELKALRLPKKLSGEGHRGYAFVEYLTDSGAKKAFDSLCQSTHLYGRRLVLEWADIEADDTTGKRSANHFVLEEDVKNKRAKMSKSVFNIE